MKRRSFLRRSGGLFGLSLVSTSVIIESCNNAFSNTPQGPNVNFTLDLNQTQNSALKNPGGWVSSHGVIVVNNNGTFVAISQTCTHQGCTVSYYKSYNEFICPCHGGTYDINGNVIGGPPPAPLKKYTVEQNGSILTISG